MKRFFCITAIASIGAFGACASSDVRAPNESPNVATYTLTFQGKWTKDTHPLEYPKGNIISGPHFSGLIGATHSADYTIIHEQQPPSHGLEALSERGAHSPLDAEIRGAIREGRAGTLFESDGVDPNGTAKVTVRADENHPLLSVVAMIAPSPDWFTGASSVPLFDNGAWIDRAELDVFAWDSGGDDGATYGADDVDNNPKKPTMLSDSPHFLQEGNRVPVGRIIIEKR